VEEWSQFVRLLDSIDPIADMCAKSLVCVIAKARHGIPASATSWPILVTYRG